MKRPTKEIKADSKKVRNWIKHLEKEIKSASLYADLGDPTTGDLDEEFCVEAFSFDADPLEILIELAQSMAEIAREFPDQNI